MMCDKSDQYTVCSCYHDVLQIEFIANCGEEKKTKKNVKSSTDAAISITSKIKSNYSCEPFVQKSRKSTIQIYSNNKVNKANNNSNEKPKPKPKPKPTDYHQFLIQPVKTK
ncbi:hypothetical protein DERF_001219 [Dermatophagoides farinae]|uniref:Uncharacterized protein n=1 Tax=Dermatophagoides farinae TaxID=6954 RepID=A0A922L9F3_DERFA|nr:hypothetical protein DERF_001219 [Dermatophagoides farinae]